MVGSEACDGKRRRRMDRREKERGDHCFPPFLILVGQNIQKGDFSQSMDSTVSEEDSPSIRFEVGVPSLNLLLWLDRPP